MLLRLFKLSIRFFFSSGNILLGSACCRATTTVRVKKNEAASRGWSSAGISQMDAAGGQELPPALSTPRDSRPVQDEAGGWGKGGEQGTLPAAGASLGPRFCC